MVKYLVIHIISFTNEGYSLSKRIKNLLLNDSNDQSEDSVKIYFIKDVKLVDWVSTNFKKGNFLVFIGAAGIAVRAISPLSKKRQQTPRLSCLTKKVAS